MGKCKQGISSSNSKCTKACKTHTKRMWQLVLSLTMTQIKWWSRTVVQKFSIARTTYNSLVLRVAQNIDLYRRALLYARDRGQQISLVYNYFEYRKTMDACKLRDRFLKKAYFQSYIREIADKRPYITRSVCLVIGGPLVLIWWTLGGPQIRL